MEPAQRERAGDSPCSEWNCLFYQISNSLAVYFYFSSIILNCLCGLDGAALGQADGAHPLVPSTAPTPLARRRWPGRRRPGLGSVGLVWAPSAWSGLRRPGLGAVVHFPLAQPCSKRRSRDAWSSIPYQ